MEWSTETEGDAIFTNDPVEIAPLETATVDWRRFNAERQPMPSNIGRERGVTVSCIATGWGRRMTAAFR